MGGVPIAPEGWRVVGVVAAGLGVPALVGSLAGWWGLWVPWALGVGFCLWFFRDPERVAPGDDHLVVSPADGKVIDVRPVAAPELLGTPATRVSIFMSPLDVHVNRSPVAGRIEAVRYTPGRFHAAFADKASDDNERTAMVLAGGGRRYLVVQIAGALARRIVCRRRQGDALARGERYGLIMFGSRVDLYLPPDVAVRVAEGARVRAGVSVIGEIP
ncbi:MAG TPA: phosphatidylserine decarboxylase family protein [Candidatus Limnocylindria bacterium]|nr:phosphatidylserine decarboxylase family protein [Candidatus Limnocylindria bacterium]